MSPTRQRNQRGHVFNASSNVCSHVQTVFPFIDELAHSTKLPLNLVSHILNKNYNTFQSNEKLL
jgi:restriction endonuclease